MLSFPRLTSRVFPIGPGLALAYFAPLHLRRVLDCDLIIPKSNRKTHDYCSNTPVTMLAPSWPFTTSTQYAQYIPPRPSPLSPRSANVLSPRKVWARDTMSKQSPVDQSSKPVPQSSSSSLVPQKSSSSANKSRKNAPPAFALRGGAKPNPLMRKEGDQRERRRDLFMKKVQTGREDKRWEGRTDQVCLPQSPSLFIVQTLTNVILDSAL